MDLPPIPPPGGAHPIVVHLPIGLLIAAPVLVVLSLFVWRLRQGVALAALAVMAMGATGAILAVRTGHEAAEHARKTAAGAAAKDLIEQHETAGERARTGALILVVAYAFVAVVPVVRGKEWTKKNDLFLHAGFLAAYAMGLLYIAHAAHLGGRLVHERGVHAPVAAPPPPSPPDDDGDGGRGRGRGGR
ncbi:MAG TPA: DUF2231 domain-containing protein [Planctomycetota bacterium]|nr:DUF2231 domain-containing protein [Planctomycetota bacterium]